MPQIAHTIAVVGGTGPQGRGLAYRFARHGHDVVVGSRSAERAAETAAEIRDRGITGQVSGAANADAAAGADVVVLAVPYEGHDELVASLADALAEKVLISCVNPLGFDQHGPYGLDVSESAAESAARLVPTARVTGAFHHVSAVTLWGPEEFLSHEDVLVVGDDTEAVDLVCDLAATVTGRPGVKGGRLRLARQLEPLTAVLISINKAYKTRSGVAISGVEGR
ncbi:NADPH-dependent F420 reductase [Nocardioides mangrovicus]|uniref:NADPH-dependent F420 reductase n=1 Tax=Nocardioides mangrovicus TaxID=2478913 RepID=A0A3L8NZJ7_9ACTN|nr:NADPH-dependent F420 reductase [Nocardioides mangrovicus]RLV48605.1 NADPH-dependent F420 reductase [Nocardioides mangrovicus]